MTDSVDSSHGEPVEQVFGESVTVSADPFGTFDDVDGYEDAKRRLHRLVVEPSGYDEYGTASALLFGESAQSPTTELARALTGAVGGAHTCFHVESLEGTFMEGETNIEAVLQAARDRAPSVVVLDCLDDYAFDETEYGLLEQHLDRVRTGGERVLLVGTATEEDADLVTNEALFEVVVDVPAPDEQYRHSVVGTALSEAEATGVATFESDGESRLGDVDTYDLSVPELRTAVKRAIQRARTPDATLPVTVRPAAVQSAIDAVDAERFDDRAEGGIFGFGDDTDQFEPEIPAVTFGDIGGLEPEKRRLREAVTIPVEYSETFRDAGYSVGQGILLHGPPGNGKTMLAKAVANELDYHFLSVKGPELEQPLVGESERELRELFQAAREHAPSVVFFDEFDSLAPSRAGDSYHFKDDMVNTLLSELDGLEPLEDVLVLAATNRLDRLDPAVLRSGRFDTFIQVPPPDAAARRDIFDVHASRLPLADGVSAEWFETVALPDCSGADIAAICRKALEFAVSAFDGDERDALEVTRADVRTAVEHLRTGLPAGEDLPEFR